MKTILATTRLVKKVLMLKRFGKGIGAIQEPHLSMCEIEPLVFLTCSQATTLGQVIRTHQQKRHPRLRMRTIMLIRLL